MSERHCHHNNSAGSLNTLLLGALLGAGFMLLFGTKRGKKLAEDFAQQGLLALEDFEGLLEELREETGPEEIVPASSTPQITQVQSELMTVHKPTHSQKDDTFVSVSKYPTNISIIESSPSQASYFQSIQEHGRRFFRGTPKKN